MDPTTAARRRPRTPTRPRSRLSRRSPSRAPRPETFTNDKCKGNQDSSNALRVGGILPLTGNLAFLGPPEISGVGLAVSEINAAGGVDITACHDIQDSGDSTDMSVSSSASAQTLIASKPSVVIGAASSSVSLNVVDTFADNKIVEISPANTAIDLSGYSPWYFRTAPPDTIQGSALGTLISSDGYQKIAFLVFNDTYGTGLRNAVQATVEGAGGECVYGCKDEGNEFPAGQTTFSTEVGAALASNPDAIVILAFDETKAIVPELKGQGWDMTKTYYSDGNTADYSKDFAEGHPRGRPGHHPRRRRLGRVQGPPQRLVRVGRGLGAGRLRLRPPSPTTRPSWPRSPRSRAATPLADHPEEPGRRLRCYRTARSAGRSPSAPS